MMTTPGRSFSLVIPGRPVPKQSFRQSKYGGFQSGHVQSHQGLICMMTRVQMSRVRVSQFSGEIFCGIMFYVPDKVRRDIDNLTKCVLDGLKGEAFHDDSQVKELYARVLLDAQSPRTEIFVHEGTLDAVSAIRAMIQDQSESGSSQL